MRITTRVSLALLQSSRLRISKLPIYYRNSTNLISLTTLNNHHHFLPSTPHKFIHTDTRLCRFVADRSKYPSLVESDLEEQFVQGSGPGGQNVNRLQNCVVLRHIPTGIVVKCHEDRQLHRNRKIARQRLLDRLDQHLNGADSVAEQTKRHTDALNAIQETKAAKLRLMKAQYKLSLKQRDSSEPTPNLEQEPSKLN